MGNPLMSLEFSIGSDQTWGRVKTNTPATLSTCLFNSLLCGVCGGTHEWSLQDPIFNQSHILIFHSMEQLWAVCKNNAEHLARCLQSPVETLGEAGPATDSKTWQDQVNSLYLAVSLILPKERCPLWHHRMSDATVCFCTYSFIRQACLLWLCLNKSLPFFIHFAVANPLNLQSNLFCIILNKIRKNELLFHTGEMCLITAAFKENKNVYVTD